MKYDSVALQSHSLRHLQGIGTIGIVLSAALNTFLRWVTALLLIGFTMSWLTSGGVQAQTASSVVDATFKNFGTNDTVFALVTQPDGKVLVGGAFTRINSNTNRYLARLNPDGSVDTTFKAMADLDVFAMALQSNGQLLVGGSFSHINSRTSKRLARLNPDGSLDSSFSLGEGVNGTIYSVTSLADGKIMITGDFTVVNGVTRHGVARVNADGSVDTSFQTAPGADGNVMALATQADGKVLIAGDFTHVNGVARTGIARLNTDGSVDSTFNTVMNGGLMKLALQTNGKVLVGGDFTSINGVSSTRIARLNEDGSLDTSFNAGSGADAEVMTLTLQSNGKVLIGGNFSTVNNKSYNRVARLNSDGSVDTTLNLGKGVDGTVYTLVAQPNGKALIGGYFSLVDNTILHSIARLNVGSDEAGTGGTGTGLTGKIGVDPSFAMSGIKGTVYSFVKQTDGKLIIRGTLNNMDGTTYPSDIARLNTDGSLDTSFNTKVKGVNALALQSDGQILIGGGFKTVNDKPLEYLARLNTDGSIDDSLETMLESSIRTIAVQSNNKILIGGDFQKVNGLARSAIARLNVDGSVDTSFAMAHAYDNYRTLQYLRSVNRILIKPDDSLTVIGYFSEFSSSSMGAKGYGVIHRGANNSYFRVLNFEKPIDDVSVQSNGKVIIAGDFPKYVQRYNADGTLDTFFATEASHPVKTVIVQPDDKILIGGSFTGITGKLRTRVARLNADGTVDTTFDTRYGANGTVYSLTLEPDGKLFASGSLTNFAGTPVNYFTRLTSITP